MTTDKSYFNPDPKLKYCVQHSYKLLPIQDKLIQISLGHPRRAMLGAPEVIQTCSMLIQGNRGKNVLDIGTFTGLSAMSWALAIPDDGRVVTMDISDENYNAYGKPFVDEAGLGHKIDLRVQPALKTLDELIAAGQLGQFDFAFIDAEKTEYPLYYEKCLQLLRPGGFIAVDNALWSGRVLQAEKDAESTAIDDLNKRILDDSRVTNLLLPIGDGLNIVFKK